MKVEMSVRCQSPCELTDPDDIKLKVASAKEDPDRFIDFSPRMTDTGDLVSLNTNETLKPGVIYDLPTEQALKLIGFGYATQVT